MIKKIIKGIAKPFILPKPHDAFEVTEDVTDNLPENASVVTDTETLEAHIKELVKEPFVTIDTEFHRERTYYPQLCLMQIAGKDRSLAVDVLSKDIDLTCLKKLFRAKKVVKVFHSMGQDMEIMLNRFDMLPNPVFDTQVAAKMLGYGESISYAKLVQKICGEEIDKTSRFTDWAKRPLDQAQIEYAISDVTYLRKIYRKLKKDLIKRERVEWYDEEMERLICEDMYWTDPETVWERLKLRSDDPRYVSVVKHVAAWRELRAQTIDVPRGRVMRDEALMEIATAKPTTKEALKALRFVRNVGGEKDIEQLIAAVKQGIEAPVEKKQKVKPVYVNPAMMDMMKILLKAQSDEHDIAPSVIAKVDDLKAIVAETGEKMPAMEGWRYELFGKHAEALLEGKIAVTVKGRKIKLIDLDGAKPKPKKRASHGKPKPS